MAASLAVTAAMLTALPAAPAAATGGGGSSVPGFACSADTVYSVDGGSHVISRITPSTGAAAPNGTIGAGHDDAVNALALAGGGGRYIYAFNRSTNKVLRFDATTGSTQSYSAPANPDAADVIAGAINPANGIYYYAVGGSPWKLYAYHTSSNTGIGQVGTIAGLSVNGDMAFDAVGNLYVVSNASYTAAGTLARVNGPLPTTAGSTSFSSTPLASLPGNSGQYASMAFDGTGVLVIGTGSGKVLRVNPSSGAQIDTHNASVNLADMASCSSPSVASVRVDLPSGRHDADDQFTTTITGGGVSSGNTGTTTGTDSGLQTQAGEVAGPVVALPGTTYTITQTAAGGTQLGDYATTWKCTLQADGSTIAQGTGSSGTFTMPSSSGSTVVCTFTNTPLFPAIDLTKTAGPIIDNDGNGPDAADTITYDFTVTNTGNVALNPVTVTDPKLGAITCPSDALAAGASVSCTQKTYALTQADVDSGKVDNTATAHGTPPTGPAVTDTDTVSTPVPKLPAIELDKTGGAINDNDGNGPDAGDTITYSFKVTNTGNVTLNPVTVTDPKLGAITCPTGALAPGASVTCTPKSYTLLQSDVNAGKIENTATAHGSPPSGPEVTDTDTVNIALPGSAAIEVDKTAGTINDLDGNGPDVGDTITYTFLVTNTGTVTLNPVTVTDPKVGPITCPNTALAPGVSVSCTPKTYVLTQNDVDTGKVENTATAHGTPPSGPEVTDTDSTTTPIASLPSIELDKTAGPIDDLDGNGPDAGDTIGYDFTVTNSGNVTLNPVTVTDPKVGPITCPPGALLPGASASCTQKTYVLTQADVDAGTVDNTATAHGSPPSGSPVADTDSTHTGIAVADPAIRLVKGAGTVNDVNGNGIDDGDTITYTFEVTNLGNVTLTNIAVTDPKIGAVTCPNVALAPGASVDCDPRVYPLTQADVDHGGIHNTAVVTGRTPAGDAVTDDDDHTVDLPASGAIQLIKSAGEINDLDGNGPDAGDTITYSFEVTNTGNVRLDPVVVSDPKVGPVSCPTGGLDPDESFTCTDVTYAVTQADVDHGSVDNTATATGTTPDHGTVQSTSSTTTPVEPTVTNVAVAKTVDDATPREGEVITYTLRVTNTGAADAEDVTIVDHLPSGVTYVSAQSPCVRSGSTVTCAVGTLPSGASRSYDVQVRVDPLPALGADHQHLFDVQKTEVHVDVEPGDEATGTATCQPGYVVTDGSGRIDHVDQGTGTLADLHLVENRAVGTDGWRAHFVNDATGRAQAKVFAVCVQTRSETVNGHSHDLVVGAPLTQTQALPTGRTDVTMSCGAGQTPIQPGYELGGVAPVVTTYPDGAQGWRFAVVNDGAPTSGAFTLRCLDVRVSTANGHTHQLGLDEVRQTVTVPAGQEAEVTLSCAADAKGIVAGYDVDPGLVVLGNDPRPIVRVFKFFNPTGGPLQAKLYLHCLANRTEKGAGQGGTIVNTATVTTSTPETSTGDNADSVTVHVDTSPAVVPVAPTVVVTSARVAATVKCGAGGGVCRGRAALVAASTQKVGGHLVKRGAVLAQATYRIRSGSRATLQLKQTALGKRALRGLTKAQLRIDGAVRTVRIKH
ncbi:DUF11 domain-containing protein [Nocardioides sp.]|uniref:DUF11 domain-containing protein n=1 Tax=Nocardioides sp. TaxID=35761 RepID=UPI002ED965A8